MSKMQGRNLVQLENFKKKIEKYEKKMARYNKCEYN